MKVYLLLFLLLLSLSSCLPGLKNGSNDNGGSEPAQNQSPVTTALSASESSCQGQARQYGFDWASLKGSDQEKLTSLCERKQKDYQHELECNDVVTWPTEIVFEKSGDFETASWQTSGEKYPLQILAPQDQTSVIKRSRTNLNATEFIYHLGTDSADYLRIDTGSVCTDNELRARLCGLPNQNISPPKMKNPFPSLDIQSVINETDGTFTVVGRTCTYLVIFRSLATVAGAVIPGARLVQTQEIGTASLVGEISTGLIKPAPTGPLPFYTSSLEIIDPFKKKALSLRSLLATADRTHYLKSVQDNRVSDSFPFTVLRDASVPSPGLYQAQSTLDAEVTSYFSLGTLLSKGFTQDNSQLLSFIPLIGGVLFDGALYSSDNAGSLIRLTRSTGDLAFEILGTITFQQNSGVLHLKRMGQSSFQKLSFFHLPKKRLLYLNWGTIFLDQAQMETASDPAVPTESVASYQEKWSF